MERPTRKAKAVNFCYFGADYDEDFASVKAPPSKRPREDVKPPDRKRLPSKFSSQEPPSQATDNPKNRKPLDEKLHERDLEAALTLSLLQAADEKQIGAHTADFQEEAPGGERSDPSLARLSNCSVNVALLGLDTITLVQGSSCTSTRRTKVSKKTEREEDEDYQPKLTPESDDGSSGEAESEEEEEEEFTVKEAKKPTANRKTKPPTQPPVLTREKPPPEAPPCKPQTPASTRGRSPPPPKLVPEPSRPVCRPSPISPAGGRIPKWTPPGQVGGAPSPTQGATGRSPGSGLRLGLSRRGHVKPLHPAAAGP